MISGMYRGQGTEIYRKRGTKVFEKKDYIYSETMGVCQVTDIVKLTANSRFGIPVPYYQLRSIFDKAKVAYIPVENHQVSLRPLISKEEAAAISPEELEKLDDKRKEEVRFVLEQEQKAGK